MVIILPKKKQKLLQYLKEYIKNHNYAPTLTEIAEEFNLSSLATVHEHLQFLEDNGFIKRDKDIKRSITIPELVFDSLSAMSSRPNGEVAQTRGERESAKEESVLVPVVGLITAGEPIEAIENRDLELPVPKEMVKNKNSYILKVKGDSMVESLITDGDFVICEKTEYAKNGDTVVAMLEDGTATLKKFFKTKNLIRLQPANKNYKPQYEKNVIIQGRVLGIIRKF